MAAAVPYLILGGTALSMSGTLAEGEAAEEAGKLQASQYAKNAIAAQAEGTRKAGEIRRQGEALKSDAAAAMAAGGGVTDDVGAIETFADIEQAVDYNALAALYEGKSRADTMDFAGRTAKWEGKAAKSASRTKALGTALSGAGMAYGGGYTGTTPTTTTTPPLRKPR